MNTPSQEYLDKYNVELTGEFRFPKMGDLVPSMLNKDQIQESASPWIVGDTHIPYMDFPRWILRKKPAIEPPSPEWYQSRGIKPIDGKIMTWAEALQNHRGSACVYYEYGQWSTAQCNAPWDSKNEHPTILVRGKVTPWTMTTCPEVIWCAERGKTHNGFFQAVNISPLGARFIHAEQAMCETNEGILGKTACSGVWVSWDTLARNWVQRNGNPCGIV